MRAFLRSAIFCAVVGSMIVSCTVRSADRTGTSRRLNVQPNECLSLSTSDFVDSVEYIPLETTVQSELVDISQVEVVGDYYVILDKFVNQILFFKKNGDFVRKISAKSKSLPLPFKSILYFTVDSKQGVISVPDFQSPFIYEFDLKGEFVGIKEKGSADYMIRESYCLDNYKLNYLSYKYSESGETDSPNIIVTENGKERDACLYFNPSITDKNDLYGAQRYFFKSNEQVLFSRPYDYTIYSFDQKGKMNEYFQIILPEKYRVPSDFLSSTKYINKRKKYTEVNKSVIYKITDVYKVDDILTFKLIGSGYSNTFLYDLRKDILIDYRNYLSDSSTHFLPIAGMTNLGVSGNRLISSVSSPRMIQLLNMNIDIEGYLSSLPENLLEYYKKGNRQNPVLVLTTFKQTIDYES